jgi:hypothetical protein
MGREPRLPMSRAERGRLSIAEEEDQVIYFLVLTITT